MAKDLHNFHLFCPRKWHYNGDVNIENGGMFLHAGQIQAGDERVDCVGVTRRGQSNLWQIRFGEVWLGKDCSRLIPKERLAEELGWGLDVLDHGVFDKLSTGHTFLRHMQVEFCAQTWGVEDAHDLYIQIGKTFDGQDSDNVDDPDVVLPHNARIENWLRKNALRDRLS